MLLGAVTTTALVNTSAGDDKEKRHLLRFAVEMAKQGSWREARFRWERAINLDPENPYILNNLAVSMEATGRQEDAGELYARAVDLSWGDTTIAENARRHSRRLVSANNGEKAGTASMNPGSRKAAPKRTSKKPKGLRVGVTLPVPPRLDVADRKNLLVVSFLVPESALLDINREMVQYLRSEFRRATPLEILDITPPPAIPEQRVEDLIANAEFWRHLGREYDTDLVVSGVASFGRRDASGFQEVDMISPTTGHKRRETRFVEQEQFTYRLEIFYMDGRTGELLLRDQMQRTATFQGLANDPITAFYELSELIRKDILSALTPQEREDMRVIFQG